MDAYKPSLKILLGLPVAGLAVGLAIPVTMNFSSHYNVSYREELPDKIILEKTNGLLGYVTYTDQNGSISINEDALFGQFQTLDRDGDGTIDWFSFNPEGPQDYLALTTREHCIMPKYASICQEAQEFYDQQTARFKPLKEDFLRREAEEKKIK